MPLGFESESVRGRQAGKGKRVVSRE